MKKQLTIKIGSRASRLAVAQTEQIVHKLMEAFPNTRFKTILIKTRGDRAAKVPIAQIGGKGLFTKELERALLSRKIDIAIHSLKDLPTDLPPGLRIGAIPQRGDPRDIALTRGRLPLGKLPANARVGTSSLRRKTQLAAAFPHLEVVDLRGNLDTRLELLKNGRNRLEAIVVAKAGLDRLGLKDMPGEPISPDQIVPAPGQGALALEVRSDERSRKLLEPILAGVHDPLTAAAVAAERALLKRVEGGCLVPLGAYAEPAEEGLLRLRAVIADPGGARLYRQEVIGDAGDPDGLAAAVEMKLREEGAAGAIEAYRARARLTTAGGRSKGVRAVRVRRAAHRRRPAQRAARKSRNR